VDRGWDRAKKGEVIRLICSYWPMRSGTSLGDEHRVILGVYFSPTKTCCGPFLTNGDTFLLNLPPLVSLGSSSSPPDVG